jgi:ABC-type multidrug transport system fused ATPase/permease subunit
MSVAKPILDYVKTLTTRPQTRGNNTFRRLLRYHKSYVPYFVAVIGLSILGSYLFMLEPLYTSQIIDIVTSNDPNEYVALPQLVLYIVLAVSAYGITTYGTALTQGYAAQFIINKLRSEYYRSVQNKSLGFYDSTAVGDLVSRATMDLQAVQAFLQTWVGIVASTVFTIVFVSATMYSISPMMTLISILPMPLIFYLQIQLWTKTMPLFRRMQLILGRLGAYVQQNILGMKVVRIFRREKEMDDGFKQVEKVYVDTAILAGKIQSMYMPSPQAVLTLGIIFVYLYGGNLIASAALTIGDLVLFARYMLRLNMPLSNVSMLNGQWINAAAGLERINEMVDRPVEVQDRADARNIAIKDGQVEFKNVNFGYAKDRPVLKNISFKVNPGEKIAILGSTGSGKTSLIYLIPRFYDVDSGSILIDGEDVRSFKISSLRRQIGLVLQDVFVFTGTIADNIAFGKPDASLDEIKSVAEQAKIKEFIDTLPEGFSTIVGERGVTLSGGQRQRLTIARTLLTNPKILIFDDALSFVDAKTEQDIQEAIEEAMKGRTTFMIAQRLSTIKNADRIMVLDDGKIVEFGTHSELMAQGRIYKRIYETQFLEKIPEEIVKVKAR